MRFLDVWYTRVDVDELFASLTANADAATIKAAQRSLSKARSRTSLGSLSKLATKVDGGAIGSSSSRRSSCARPGTSVRMPSSWSDRA